MTAIRKKNELTVIDHIGDELLSWVRAHVLLVSCGRCGRSSPGDKTPTHPPTNLLACCLLFSSSVVERRRRSSKQWALSAVTSPSPWSSSNPGRRRTSVLPPSCRWVETPRWPQGRERCSSLERDCVWSIADIQYRQRFGISMILTFI